jgi:hypothetical protein
MDGLGMERILSGDDIAMPMINGGCAGNQRTTSLDDRSHKPRASHDHEAKAAANSAAYIGAQTGLRADYSVKRIIPLTVTICEAIRSCRTSCFQ